MQKANYEKEADSVVFAGAGSLLAFGFCVFLSENRKIAGIIFSILGVMLLISMLFFLKKGMKSLKYINLFFLIYLRCFSTCLNIIAYQLLKKTIGAWGYLWLLVSMSLSVILLLFLYRVEKRAILRVNEKKKVSPVVVGASSVGMLGASSFKILENYIESNIMGAFCLSAVAIILSLIDFVSLVAFQCFCVLEE